MRIFLASLLIIFTGTSLFSQEKNSLDKLITMKLPSGIKKTDYALVKMIKNTKGYSSEVDFNPRIGNMFETSVGIIQINAAKGKPEKGRLENLEKSHKGLLMLGNPKYLMTEIKSINNFKVLVFNYRLEGNQTGKISFFTVNNNQDIAMSGRMEYAEGNSQQALKNWTCS